MTTTYANYTARHPNQIIYATAATPKVRYMAIVQSITRSSTTATATCKDHGIPTGSSVDVAGADQADYNGTFTITVVDGNTFTYTVSNSPATPATFAVALTVADTNQSLHIENPRIIQIDSIGSSTTVKVEACVNRTAPWTQIGSDLTVSNNGAFLIVADPYNFVRARRSTGSGAVKVWAQY